MTQPTRSEGLAELGWQALASLNVGVIVVDPDERVRVWNGWIVAHSGIAEAEALDRPLRTLFPSLEGGYLHETLRAALELGHPSVLSHSLHEAQLPLYGLPLGAQVPLMQHVHLIPLPGTPRHCMIQVTDASAALKREAMLKRKARLLQESLELQHSLINELEHSQDSLELLVQERTTQLEELAGHLQDLSEREKAKLARELHDELGAILTAIRIDISWLQRSLGELPPMGAAKLQRMLTNLDRGIQLKRRIMEGMRPTLLSTFGIVVTLRELVREVAALNQWALTLHLPDDDLQLSEELSITVFRVTQEALTNAAKYAEATRVSIVLSVDERELLLAVEDNGVGINEQDAQAPRRHGILGMKHRVFARGGSFELQKVAPHGTRVVARMPR
ncbi:sensor histidine kinase [Chitiniphilus eburneus]|uniref:Histidine kinase domain-containing protein n=1 Tax=Chitiniphilus eburneus TaxID=2571148 RepID=A0A4U0QBK8_9NEIS|nr:histidine kinase [Chitiniphilus eburneus]TJZ78747.1 hypothetical protein FAZ21_00180 [Chitiniphilus eburneus]